VIPNGRKPTEATGPSLAVRSLTRRFKRGLESVTALDDVSFGLNPGELTVAAGPSGSGKTTLLSILAGLERTDAGDVRTGDPLPARVPAAKLPWRHLAFIPQSQALLEELSVWENVDMPARLDRGAAGTETDAILESLEISHLADRYPSQISGGEAQRTAIARALRLKPFVLIGDEPTGHQDRSRVGLVLGILRQHAYAGNIVLISSHDEDVISSADRIITLTDGRVTSDQSRRGWLAAGSAR
jgi:putative ABC transport system ATP-binding protein